MSDMQNNFKEIFQSYSVFHRLYFLNTTFQLFPLDYTFHRRLRENVGKKKFLISMAVFLSFEFIYIFITILKFSIT